MLNLFQIDMVLFDSDIHQPRGKLTHYVKTILK